jgi:hypothetical protein
MSHFVPVAKAAGVPSAELAIVQLVVPLGGRLKLCTYGGRRCVASWPGSGVAA